MQLTWLGHSCFLLEDASGARLLTDPCDPQTGYDIRGLRADVVTISHDHHDHNYTAAVAGEPEIVNRSGSYRARGLCIDGFESWHDAERGAERGPNLIFRIGMDGLNIVHLGDLGHVVDDALAERIGPVDVLLCPVGGRYTIDAGGAGATAEKLNPRIFIPMHYQTAALSFQLSGVEELARYAGGRSIHRLNANSCTILPETLGEAPRILILDYLKQG